MNTKILRRFAATCFLVVIATSLLMLSACAETYKEDTYSKHKEYIDWAFGEYKIEEGTFSHDGLLGGKGGREWTVTYFDKSMAEQTFTFTSMDFDDHKFAERVKIQAANIVGKPIEEEFETYFEKTNPLPGETSLVTAFSFIKKPRENLTDYIKIGSGINFREMTASNLAKDWDASYCLKIYCYDQALSSYLEATPTVEEILNSKLKSELETYLLAAMKKYNTHAISLTLFDSLQLTDDSGKKRSWTTNQNVLLWNEKKKDIEWIAIRSEDDIEFGKNFHLPEGN